ncbi:ATP-dependent 6-phosphofructokinase 2 [Abeliophyllum distichum]|uniref:ATP-dependent 6-phosphofructokinase 2 n=1 Tax=Abeliophyllum distichum TaxID=126358 RepID=A0ABD1RUJ6_9LAMI
MAFSSNTIVDRQQQLELAEHQFTISNIKLQRLAHLTDYLPDLQIHSNPLDQNPFFHLVSEFYITPSDFILRHILHDLLGAFPSSEPYLEYHWAGPRKQIYFDPCHVRAAIVTCGGLCPGMNTVIRELVVGLWELYGVRE